MRFVIIATGALLLLAAGCSKQPESDGVASAGGVTAQPSADPSRPAENPADRVLQFVACMRDQGIDMPDPEPGDATGKEALRFAGPGTDKATFGAAMEKCHEYLPQGGENTRRTPEQIEARRQFARCMRENGIPNYPDPDAEGNWVGVGEVINKEDPAVRAIVDKCQVSR